MKRKIAFIAVTLIIMLIVSRFMIRIVDATVQIDEYIAAQDELSEYSVNKGTIRVPYDKPLPTELIEKIARWCYEKHSSQMIR